MAGKPIDTLLRNIFDYAGVFPPAGLTTPDAMVVYERARHGDDAWMLGSFVISAERIGEPEFQRARDWPLSVILSAHSETDVEHVLRACDGMRLAAIEFRPVAVASLRPLAAAIPAGVEAYFEVPADNDVERQLDAIATSGAHAKIRTGGITTDAFPPAPALYRFMRGCAERKLGAKATAGLHHAITGCYRLTYDAASTTAQMYGFLNVCTSAALVCAGTAEADVLASLHDSSPTAFRLNDTGLQWRDAHIPVSALAATRASLFRSFGTCSLDEPMSELRRMLVL